MAVRWRDDMRMTNDDRTWSRALAQYARNEDAHVPPAGKFNAGQKQFFYVALLSAALLLVSGLVLWRPDLVPPGAGVLRQAAVLVHSAAAFVAIGALVVHVYMGVAVVPGSLHAIVRGEVSSAWAKAHHRLWHEDVSDAPRGRP
jgi:formate dehydrogenase subunit gamma